MNEVNSVHVFEELIKVQRIIGELKNLATEKELLVASLNEELLSIKEDKKKYVSKKLELLQVLKSIDDSSDEIKSDLKIEPSELSTNDSVLSFNSLNSTMQSVENVQILTISSPVSDDTSGKRNSIIIHSTRLSNKDVKASSKRKSFNSLNSTVESVENVQPLTITGLVSDDTVVSVTSNKRKLTTNDSDNISDVENVSNNTKSDTLSLGTKPKMAKMSETQKSKETIGKVMKDKNENAFTEMFTSDDEIKLMTSCKNGHAIATYDGRIVSYDVKDFKNTKVYNDSTISLSELSNVEKMKILSIEGCQVLICYTSTQNLYIFDFLSGKLKWNYPCTSNLTLIDCHNNLLILGFENSKVMIINNYRVNNVTKQFIVHNSVPESFVSIKYKRDVLNLYGCKDGNIYLPPQALSDTSIYMNTECDRIRGMLLLKCGNFILLFSSNRIVLINKSKREIVQQKLFKKYIVDLKMYLDNFVILFDDHVVRTYSFTKKRKMVKIETHKLENLTLHSLQVVNDDIFVAGKYKIYQLNARRN